MVSWPLLDDTWLTILWEFFNLLLFVYEYLSSFHYEIKIISPFILSSEIMAWDYPLLLLQILNHAIKSWIIKLKNKNLILSHRWVPSLNLFTVYISVYRVAVSGGQVVFTSQQAVKGHQVMIMRPGKAVIQTLMEQWYTRKKTKTKEKDKAHMWSL